MSTRMKYRFCLSSSTSSSMAFRPPKTAKNAITDTNSASIASSSPALISLPQGAGKWPMKYTKDSPLICSFMSNVRDITITSPRTILVRCLAYLPFSTNVTIAQNMHNIIEKKGKLLIKSIM